MKNSEAPLRKSRIGRREFIRAGAALTAAIAAPKAGAAPAPSPEPAQKKELQPWWAARPAGPKANQPISIDLHTHWLPPTYTKALADVGKPVANINPLEADLDQRRKWMDQHGVQMHLLALSGDAVWQLVTPEQSARLAQIVNDAALEAHAGYPDRFVAAIELPITDAGLCIKELDRMAGKPGMRAVNLGDTIGGRDYVFEPEFAPVLARCEELGYPLVFHNMNTDPFGKRPAGPGLDAAFTHAVLAAKFIGSGTLWTSIRSLRLCCRTRAARFPIVRDAWNISCITWEPMQGRPHPRTRSRSTCGDFITTTSPIIRKGCVS